MNRSGLGTPWRWPYALFCFFVLTYLVFPLSVIVPISFSSATGLQFPPPGFSLKWYRAYFGSETWTQATLTSFQIAALATVLATVLGTLAALALHRARFPGKGFLQAFFISPILIPVIIIAVAIYRLYAELDLVGSRVGVALAHAVLAMPYVLVTVSATLVGLDPMLERAALGLGANRWRAFGYVTLPLIRPGVLAGALFAFITSFDEVVIVIFIGSWSAETLPKVMWESIRTGIDPVISAVSVLLISLSVAILITVHLLQRWTERLRGVGSPLSR